MPGPLERFIPISLDELHQDLLSQATEVPVEATLRARLYRILLALYHAEFHERTRELKIGYTPFNPDRDTCSRRTHDAAALANLQQGLLAQVQAALVRANFVVLSGEDINQALNKTSPHGVEVSVDFEAYEEMMLFYRGSDCREEYKRDWRSLFLRKISVQVPIYRRLFLLLKAKPLEQRIRELAAAENLSLARARRRAIAESGLLPDEGTSCSVYIKLFRDIPHSDLEMLFPNTRVRMRTLDKLNLAVTGGGGTIGGIFATVTKLSAAANPLTAASAIAGLAGVIWRQISKVFARRTHYMATLAKNLYFYSLDNNAGALAHLVDLAEVEECKEAMLAYHFLCGEADSSVEELDARIERWLETNYDTRIDFEIEDGLNKLERLELLQRSADGRLRVLPLREAVELLNRHWDELFDPDRD